MCTISLSYELANLMLNVRNMMHKTVTMQYAQILMTERNEIFCSIRNENDFFSNQRKGWVVLLFFFFFFTPDTQIMQNENFATGHIHLSYGLCSWSSFSAQKKDKTSWEFLESFILHDSGTGVTVRLPARPSSNTKIQLCAQQPMHSFTPSLNTVTHVIQWGKYLQVNLWWNMLLQALNRISQVAS